MEIRIESYETCKSTVSVLFSEDCILEVVSLLYRGSAPQETFGSV